MRKAVGPISFSGFSKGGPVLDTQLLQFEGVPAGLIGKRIVFVSDIHMSWMYPERAVVAFLEDIQSLNPDLILWGGDYSESYKDGLRFFELAERLHPPMGMYGVIGNNDAENFEGKFLELRRVAAKAGIRILINRTSAIEVEGGRLVIAGTDEIRYGNPSGRMLNEDARKGDFRILLAHSPQSIDMVLRHAQKKPMLALCGHTHGGQWAIGNFSLYSLRYEYGQWGASRYFALSGLREIDGMQVLISNGIGTSRLPLRIGARPQIHLLQLSIL